MYMEDEEYVFHQTNKERKVIGRSAFSKVRGGGRHVRMPSDSMTRKEQKAMNGEVVSYCLSKPMGWRTFRGMPDDLKHRYVDWMKKSFPGINQTLVAEAVGATGSQFTAYTSTHGLNFGFTKSCMQKNTFLRTGAGKAYSAWLRGESVVKDEPDVEAIDEPDEVPVDPAVGEPVGEKKVVVKSGGVDINNIAVLLNMLAGTGAKLTIEIAL